MKFIYWLKKTFIKNGCKKLCMLCSNYEECKNYSKHKYLLKVIDTKGDKISTYIVHDNQKRKIGKDLREKALDLHVGMIHQHVQERTIVLWVHKDEFYDVINMFGNYVLMFEGKDGHYIAHLEERIDNRLFAFLITRGNKVRLLEPELAINKLLCMLQEARHMYSIRERL